MGVRVLPVTRCSPPCEHDALYETIQVCGETRKTGQLSIVSIPPGRLISVPRPDRSTDSDCELKSESRDRDIGVYRPGVGLSPLEEIPAAGIKHSCNLNADGWKPGKGLKYHPSWLRAASRLFRCCVVRGFVKAALRRKRRTSEQGWEGSLVMNPKGFLAGEPGFKSYQLHFLCSGGRCYRVQPE